MLRKKEIHDRQVRFEDDDEVRPGFSYLRDLDGDKADEIFRRAKEEGITDFKDDESRRFQLIRSESSSSGSTRYIIVRKGSHNDSSSWF